MELAPAFADARLVELYDTDNPGGSDHDFYRSLAAGIGARRIVDLGCGTGLLTRSLAGTGRTVVGIDPSEAMLDFAGRQTGSEQVTWILGDADAVPSFNADLALMTGNVAQVFLTDEQWHAALAALYRSLRPDGMLAFETRNPAAAAFANRMRDGSYKRRWTRHGYLVRWLEDLHEHSGLITYESHTLFERTGEHLISRGGLRFRTAQDLERDLEIHGFRVQNVFGDWARGRLSAASAVMVFCARRLS